MDFGDSPGESEFRQRLRDMAGGQQSRPAGFLDGRRVLGAARPPGTNHCTTPGSSGWSWPTEIGGHGLSTVFEVIVDEELAAAGAPPRPEPRLPGAGGPRARERGDQAPLPPRHRETAATGGARVSASPMPAPTSPRCAPAPT